MSEDEQGQSWHLDRRVPIVMLIAILGQAFAFGAMLANMDGRINANSTSFARLSHDLDAGPAPVDAGHRGRGPRASEHGPDIA